MPRVLRAFFAGLVLAGLIVAIPYGLVAMVGNPLAVWPAVAAGDISNEVILAVLAVVVWVAWAQFALATFVEFVSAVRRTPIPAHIPGVARFQQGAARALVSALLMLTPAIGGIIAPAVAGAASAPVVSTVTVASYQQQPDTAATVDSSATGRHAAAEAAPTMDVVIGAASPRTWWDLAAEHTGDGANWRTLYELNSDQAQPGGVRPTETGLFRDGWTLRVPAPDDAVATDIADASTVTVVPGDSLSSIAAEKTGDADNWPELFNANEGVPQADGRALQDPNLIRPGWTITIPLPASAPVADAGAASDAAEKVTVAPGDSLSSIAAEKTGDADNWPELFNANEGVPQADGRALQDPNLIQPGWTITIPAGLAAVADTGAAVGETPEANDTASVTDAGPTSPVTGDGVTVPSTTAEADGAVAPDDAVTVPTAPADAGGADASVPAPSSSPVTTAAPVGDPTPVAASPQSERRTAPASAQSAPEISTGTLEGSEITTSEDSVSESVGWPLWLSATGGVMLAGLLFGAIQTGRRRGLRYRRPGRVLEPIPAGQVPLAHAVAEVGMASAADAAWLTRALRHAVSAAEADAAGLIPDVVAARLSSVELELVLAAPAGVPAPAPWTETGGGYRWRLPRSAPIDLPEDVEARMPHPFPLLATIGHTDDGDVWLVDVEMIGALRIDGDHGRATDLMRYMAVELAHNSWTDVADVLMVGFGHEMAAAAPGGLRSVTLARAGDETAWLARAIEASRTPGHTSVASGRLHAAGGDWTGQAVLTCLPDDGDLGETWAPLADARRRLSLGVIGTADSAVPGGWTVTIDENGLLSIPQLGITVVAERLPASEAAELAELLAAMRSLEDQPASSAEAEPESGAPAASYRDDLGRVRDDLAESEPAAGPHLPGAHVRAGSLLPKAAEEYEATGAALTADVTALAPIVSAKLADEIAAADPKLDGDVADWWDENCARPKLTLLGAVGLKAAGELDRERPRSAQLTEIAAYLATHPRGVTADRLGTDLWPTGRSVVRRASTMTSKLRTWLGGEAYLPKLTGQTGGDGLYRLTADVLVDADLVARLRTRAHARGEDGITDLQTALDLVGGRPFDAGRASGYAWLTTGVWEQNFTAMIDDIAHLAVIFYLDHGDGHSALQAAQAALRGGVGSDTPLVDCAAALRSLGMNKEAEQRIRQILDTHEDTFEEDLSARITELLEVGGWRPERRASAAL